METVKVVCKPNALLPKRATDRSAGYDLHAAIDSIRFIYPGEWELIPTGLFIALPSNMEAQVRPRSGLAAKHGVTVLNAPGTIDADYRGEVKVILINHGDEPFVILPGMRVAQLVFAPVLSVDFEVVATLDETDRGAGGFGSTGF